MPREPIVRHRDGKLVRYPPERFELLAAKRALSVPFLRALPGDSRLYGSLARGDVRPGSDVDIAVPFGTNSFAVEMALSRAGKSATQRLLVQATPNAVIKALWDFGQVTVSLPLTRPSPVEEGFAGFAGAVSLPQVEASVRVPGIDKRLMLIGPAPEGHLEQSVDDRTDECARLLGIDPQVILARVRVLRRRSRTGRTGVFLTRVIGDDDTPESALARVTASSPAVRRAVGGRP